MSTRGRGRPKGRKNNKTIKQDLVRTILAEAHGKLAALQAVVETPDEDIVELLSR